MEIKNKEKEIINKAINDNISYQNKSEESSWFIFKTKLSNTKDMLKYNLINFNTIYKFNSFANLQIFHKKFQKNETFQNYRNKLNSFIYLSYRKNFNKIKSYRTKNFFTSDCGWGCMIRSSQMILARAIYKILKTQGIKDKIERKIKTIQYFLDNPIPKDNIPQQLISYKNNLLKKNTNKNEAIIKGIYSPFSIRMISNLGEIFKKSAGEWFSDVNLPLIYNIINSELKVIPDLKIYPFLSNIILKDIINDSFELINDDNNNNNEENILLYDNKKYAFKKMGLIFVSVRIGLYTISPEYFPSLNELFSCKEYLGFIGGKNFQASYFIGYTGNYILYIDPHYAQNTIENINNINDIASYNVKDLFQLQYKNLQTAMTLGFLFRNLKEFNDLKNFLENYSKKEYSCFSFQYENVPLKEFESEKEKDDF